MKLCTDTITVFNRKLDVDNGWDVYIPTVIRGVSWYGSVQTNVSEKGLLAADRITVRIPIDADFGGKTYVTPLEYGELDITSGAFTLANGDIMVKAEVLETMTPAKLKETYPDCCVILGVTDNRRAPNAKHFRVVGG